MSDRLYINGKLADLKDVVISETKQINNFFDVKDRQTSFTNKFILPFTPINKEIYNLLGVVGIDSNAPYRIGTATFIRGGIPTITNGRITVSKYQNGKGYSTSIQYGNIDLFAIIGKDKVSELNYTDINHIINVDNYINSFSNNYNDGYIYALADYGLFDVNDIAIERQVPSVFRRWIWDKIFSEAGFTYKYIGDDNVFESDLFVNSILTLNEGFVSETDIVPAILKLQLTAFSDYSELENTDFSDIDFSGIDLDIYDYNLGLNTPTSIVIDLNISEQFDSDDIFDVVNSKGSIKVKENGYYKISVNGNANSLYPKSFIILKNGNEHDIISENTTGDVDINYSQLIYLTTSDDVNFISKGVPGYYTYNLNIEVHFDNTSAFINFSDFFDNISKKDFIKGVMQDYGLLMQRNGNEYQFIQIEEMFNNFDNAEDWSSIFDRQISEVYKIGNYTKDNQIKYKYDADENYSDGSFKLDNETLKEESLLFSSKFRSAKITSDSIGGEVVYSAPLFTTTLNDDGSIKDVKSKKGSPFIFNVQKINASIDYNFKGLDSGSFNGWVAIGGFKQLDYNEIISNRYNLFSQNINKPHKKEVLLSMTSLDVYELNFFKLKYIKQLASYFYVNKVNGFKNGKLTKVELIRVLSNIKSFGEYNDDYSNDYNN